jgi:LPXTG-motif cell wall-anchored protein
MRKHGLTAAVCLLLLSLLLPPALAAGAEEPGQSAALSIVCLSDGVPSANIAYSLFLAALPDDGDAVCLTPGFEKCVACWPGMTREELARQGQAMKSCVLLSGLEPDYTGVTGEDGILRADVAPGIYLAVGGRPEGGGAPCFADAFLISAPGTETAESVCAPKPLPPPENETVELQALKLWKDGGYGTLRPDGLKVFLLCDGEVADTVVLTPENNWRVIWEGMEADHDWTVAEDPSVMRRYRLTVSKLGSVFVLENRYLPGSMFSGRKGQEVTVSVLKQWDDDGSEEVRPDSVTVLLLRDGETVDWQTLTEDNEWSWSWEGLPLLDEEGREIEWTVMEEYTPGYFVKVEQIGNDWVITGSFREGLPQTGQLWWPVLLGAPLGFMLLLLGIILLRKERMDEDG